jgi:hypothetical protein
MLDSFQILFSMIFGMIAAIFLGIGSAFLFVWIAQVYWLVWMALFGGSGVSLFFSGASVLSLWFYMTWIRETQV